MKALALVLTAFAGLPATPARPTGLPALPAFDWLEHSLELEPGSPELAAGGPDAGLLSESSAVDEDASDLSLDPDRPNVFVGCELALAANLASEAWGLDLRFGAPRPRLDENGHTEKDGHWLNYEQIARRSERPKSYDAYLYPLADAPVVSGYDLDKSDDEQRRGHMNAVGHGGVDLVAKIGTPIAMLRLENQIGDAEILYVGPLYGETVVTRHVVHVADGVRRGRSLREGTPVGFVGNSASPELAHLHLEARRMRDRADAWTLPGVLLGAREYSVVTDPRNVLPLRTPRLPLVRCVPRLAREPRRYWLGDSWALRLE
jgi:murein DD-endopeptidase MepM/ murein hydrolase activator NlpD